MPNPMYVCALRGLTPNPVPLLEPRMRMYELNLACAIPTYSLPEAAVPHGDGNHLQMLRDAEVIIM